MRTVSAATLRTWKRNRAKWVKALRSGKYKQANAVLFDGKGYCCLGVGAQVCGMKAKPSANVLGQPAFKFGKQMYVSPRKFMDAVGLADKGGKWWGSALVVKHGAEHFHALTDANDCGLSFKRIATIIEKAPKGLFRESLKPGEWE